VKTALGLVCAAGAGISLLVLSEVATRKWLLRPETGRKIAHMSSGVLAASFPLFLPFPAIVGLQRAERTTLGEVYFPIGVVLVALLVPHKAEYAFGVLVMGIGDAFASLIGERFGRLTYHVTSKKTYVGSVALFVTTVVLGLSTLAILRRLSGGSALAVSAIGGVVTAEEGIVGGGADNVVLPITAAALFRLLL
jgi:dolichol kinase